MEIRENPKKTKVLNAHRRPIRVIRILGRMNIGGPAIHVVLLTSGLNDKSFRSTLVAGLVGKSEGDMMYVANRHGVTPHIIPQLGRDISWWDDFVSLWKLCRLLLRERPDIVHTHTAKAGALGRLAAVLTGVPVRIHTFHGHVFHGYFGPFKTGLFVQIERLLSMVTTQIIAISSAQLRELCGRFRIAKRDKFRVIPIGLDLQPFLQLRAGPSHLRPLSLEEGDGDKSTPSFLWRERWGEGPTIGFIGRLVAVKNPKLSIQAFAQLVHKKTVLAEGRLLLVGDGELRRELEQIVESIGLGDRVQFLGWVADLLDIYSKLDLVVVTSLNEGTPVVLIEAMAAGLPFVATSVGGVSDLVVGPGHAVHDFQGKVLYTIYLNGILVGSGDVGGLAAAMDFVLSDSERRLQMGQAGRNFVRERFSRDRLLADMSQLYMDCLERSQAGRRLPLLRSAH